MDDYENKLIRMLPSDHSSQVHDWYYAERMFDILDKPKGKIRVLDLGAGDAASRTVFNRAFRDGTLEWRGVDIEDSDEIKSRPSSAPDIDYYNGVELPYDDASFDVVWTRQVLEHVRYPDSVIGEVSRVLKPGGIFAGSVSQMEPYHSRSIFNWTHYGVMTVLADHDIDVMEMRPGIDGVTLMLRSLFGRRTNLNRFFRTEAPFNVLLQNMFVDDGPRERNVRQALFQKLRTAGHIHFLSKRR